MTRNLGVDVPATRRRNRIAAATSLAVLVATFLTAPATVATPRTAAPATAAGAVRAAAAGHLGPRGCVHSGTSDTCELYAMPGTLPVLGQSIPIWGFSSTGAAGSATAPGPVLVVDQGDTVTVVLHNGLAEPMSLAFPGQPADAFTEGLATQAADAGTAPGGTARYTFVAGRPGTFLYEAGHTAGGARQVAMGLAGALVVRPAGGTAYAPAAGYPATAYDDEAVLVLSEIDPALNASPATFDMRAFRPAYALINGKPYPATDPVSTDQAHRVLLRYVNAGSRTHTMGLLGADQQQVAEDGHALRYAERAVVLPVQPGMTADTLVTMPTGPEAKLALYEQAGHLNNAGMSGADPLTVALGGMLTFLDTAAPPPSTDGVGPVATHVTAGPNPSDGLSPVTVTADLSDATTGRSAVTQAELVIDDAVTTGVGFGTPMTAAFGSVDVPGATGTISVAALDALEAGKHTVFVRALDAAGNWGVIGGVVLDLPKVGPQTVNGHVDPAPAGGASDVTVTATGDASRSSATVTAAEYFIDTVGADGGGTAMSRNRTAGVVAETAVIPAATVKALGEGDHHVFVHSKDSRGLWGPTLDITLTVDLTGPAVQAASVGPNPSNGVLTDKAHPGYLVISAEITDRDAGGALQSLVTAGEAFLDPRTAVPAGGTGIQLVAVDGAADSQTEALYGLIPISQVRALPAGTHHVFVRGQDAAGNWGDMFGVDLVVDKTAPVLGTLVGTPNPTAGADTLTLTAPVDEDAITRAEFWVGATDPGVGRATLATVSLVGSSVVASVPLVGIPAGSRAFHLRVQDPAGNWSNAVATTVSVSRPNAILADTFDSGGLAAWSATTGTVAVTAAAALPPGGANRGLEVTLKGGTGNRPAYLTDTSPTAETSYHAQFMLDAHTLTSGKAASTVLTLVAGKSAKAQVFAVQMRRTTGGVQLRTVMNRSSGGAVTGGWVGLPAGAHTVRVDWGSGPAGGASAGTLRLAIDGVTRSTAAGNTSTLRLETVLLGVSAGVTSTRTSTMAGTAWIDGFVSTRYTLP